MSQGEEMSVTRNERYKVHGEVLLAVAVLLFAIFLSFLLLFLHLRYRRRTRADDQYPEQTAQDPRKNRATASGSLMLQNS